jgi:proteasome lid subunit RPN8/RPN11
MITALSMDHETYSQLREALRWTGVEHVAFLFANAAAGGGLLLVRDIYRVPRDGFDFQSDMHVSLTDETRAHVIKRASDLGGCLVETHSHKHGPPCFSTSDLYGFQDWVPHVRWRLASRPYIALVFAGEAFDALIWQGSGDAPAPLAALIIDGHTVVPTGNTYRRLRGRRV